MTQAQFFSNGRWATTATDGPTAPMGFPVTLTWSIVADGTPISTGGTSNLISFFDGLYGNGGGGADLSLRPWFTLVEQSFERWTDLSGLSFVYEPADDGATARQFRRSDRRARRRAAGWQVSRRRRRNERSSRLHSQCGSNRRQRATRFTSATTSNSYRALRNTLMHEIGHSFGLGHVDSNSAAFLMEGFSNNSFEGPQLDDVRGVQSLYGDKYERLAGTGGNGAIAQASPLGRHQSGNVADDRHCTPRPGRWCSRRKPTS